jgi:hypothetical protein
MKGDFSRATFDPAKHYRAVLMQQGRVQLEADWNEQQAITRHRLDTSTMDLIGPHGAPFHDAGFQLATDGVTLTIGAGRYYVNGVLCQNEVPVIITDQPHLPGAALPAESGLFLAYLEVWQQHVTALEDPLISDAALGGADTATRLKTIWQVRFLPVRPPDPEMLGPETPLPEWDARNALAGGLLKARVRPMTGSAAGRGRSANAVTRPADNQLYRVEIHQGGPRHEATFMWSRDNGSVVAGVETVAGNQVVLRAAPYGHGGSFAAGQWVEVSDEGSELTGQPGVLVKIQKPFDPVTRSLVLAAAPALPEGAQRIKLRCWDGVALADSADGWIGLEDGIEVLFDVGDYHTGDYWLIPARAATGDVEWPRSGALGEDPAWRRPHGPAVQRSRLALLSFDGASWAVIADCRKLFVPMSEPPSLENLQVLDVRPFAAAQDVPLTDGSGVPADALIPGLRLMLNQAIDPAVINPAACYVTINTPFPESNADRQAWGSGLIGYRPRRIVGEVLPLDAQTLLWRPTPELKRIMSAWPRTPFAESWQVVLSESQAEWGYTADNSLEVSASPSFNGDTLSLCLNRQRLQTGTQQLGLTAILASAQGAGGSSLDTGLVFNWIDEGNYWKFVYYEERRDVGVSLVHVSDGSETQVSLAILGGFDTPKEFRLTLSQDAGRLLFWAQLFFAGGAGTPLGDVPAVIPGAPASLVGGTVFGLAANAPLEGDLLKVRFTQFRVTLESGLAVNVIPTAHQALARLTVKPGLLQPAPVAPFPAAVGGPPGADYERWFWLVE